MMYLSTPPGRQVLYLQFNSTCAHAASTRSIAIRRVGQFESEKLNPGIDFSFTHLICHIFDIQ